MPIYEYRCKHCFNAFEVLMRSTGEKATCPSCGNDELEKRLSSFNALSGNVSLPDNCGGCYSAGNCGGPADGACCPSSGHRRS